MRELFTVIALAVLSIPVVAQDFQIDPKHSSANFSVKHLMVSTVRGRFGGGVTGTIHLDPKDITKSSVTAIIKADTITTDNSMRDNDLKSAHFFEVDKYPEIKFQSSKVEKRGDNYVAVGNLTMKDVTKQVELPFTLNQADSNGKKKLGIDTELGINRFDYHVNFDPSGTTVSKDVKIEINLEANAQ
jgi:polyisoprenoid-binding protein YceI